MKSRSQEGDFPLSGPIGIVDHGGEAEPRLRFRIDRFQQRPVQAGRDEITSPLPTAGEPAESGGQRLARQAAVVASGDIAPGVRLSILSDRKGDLQIGRHFRSCPVSAAVDTQLNAVAAPHLLAGNGDAEIILDLREEQQSTRIRSHGDTGRERPGVRHPAGGDLLRAAGQRKHGQFPGDRLQFVEIPFEPRHSGQPLLLPVGSRELRLADRFDGDGVKQRFLRNIVTEEEERDRAVRPGFQRCGNPEHHLFPLGRGREFEPGLPLEAEGELVGFGVAFVADFHIVGLPRGQPDPLFQAPEDVRSGGSAVLDQQLPVPVQRRSALRVPGAEEAPAPRHIAGETLQISVVQDDVSLRHHLDVIDQHVAAELVGVQPQVGTSVLLQLFRGESESRAELLPAPREGKGFSGGPALTADHDDFAAGVPFPLEGEDIVGVGSQPDPLIAGAEDMRLFFLHRICDAEGVFSGEPLGNNLQRDRSLPPDLKTPVLRVLVGPEHFERAVSHDILRRADRGQQDGPDYSGGGAARSWESLHFISPYAVFHRHYALVE